MPNSERLRYPGLTSPRFSRHETSRGFAGLTRAATILFALLGAMVVARPTPSHAQAESTIVGAAPGWYFIPSASLTEQWDDNVFRTSSGREADFLTRITPGFTGGYHSTPFSLLGNFSFDSEIYAEHSELDGAANGKRGGVQTTYLPTRNFTLRLRAGYTESQTPSTLNTLTNVEQGRTTSTQINASPNVSYRLSPRMTGLAAYAYTDTRASDITTVTHHGDLGLSRQLTRPVRGSATEAADVGSITYGITVTEFSGASSSSTDSTTDSSSGPSSITSHTLLLGWTHYFTRLTKMSLNAGPRYEEDSFRPEASAEVSHEGKTINLTLAYFHSETTLAGQTGLVKTQGGRASVRWKPPVRGLAVEFTPAYATTTSADNQTTQDQASQDITVYSAGLAISYQLARWLTATAAYQFTRQEQRPDNLENNIASLRFDVVYPVRVR